VQVQIEAIRAVVLHDIARECDVGGGDDRIAALRERRLHVAGWLGAEHTIWGRLKYSHDNPQYCDPEKAALWLTLEYEINFMPGFVTRMTTEAGDRMTILTSVLLKSLDQDGAVRLLERLLQLKQCLPRLAPHAAAIVEAVSKCMAAAASADEAAELVRPQPQSVLLRSLYVRVLGHVLALPDADKPVVDLVRTHALPLLLARLESASATGQRWSEGPYGANEQQFSFLCSDEMFAVLELLLAEGPRLLPDEAQQRPLACMIVRLLFKCVNCKRPYLPNEIRNIERCTEHCLRMLVMLASITPLPSLLGPALFELFGSVLRLKVDSEAPQSDAIRQLRTILVGEYYHQCAPRSPKGA